MPAPAAAQPATSSGLSTAPPPRLGLNVALSLFGGRVMQVTSEKAQPAWPASNLIDGFAIIRRGGPFSASLGWSSADKSLPQEIVFGFREDRAPRIIAVSIDTTTEQSVERPDVMPRDVEIWTSSTSASDGFAKVAGAHLPREAGEHFLTFAAVAARYVKVRIVSNHGGSATQAGEVRIYEAPDGPSILDDLPKNLAAPALGGAIAWMTSQDRGHLATSVVDGTVSRDSGWASTTGPSGPGSYLPQDLVFAFRGDRSAFVERVAIDPTSGLRFASGMKQETWVKRFSLAASHVSPWEGFEEIGRFDLAEDAREQSFPVGRRLRYLRLRMLENRGAQRTTLGEVRILEGSDGRPSILLANDEDSAGDAASPTAIGGNPEREPNNTPREAMALTPGQAIAGAIDPEGDRDHFQVTVPGTDSGVLTMDLTGAPDIRTSVDLLDAKGIARQQFDPARVTAPQAQVSWRVPAGDWTLRLSQPPVSQVLIWDTSESMRGRTEDLRRAVELYVDRLHPTDRVHLIRFSSNVEVLTPDFTSDKAALKAAMANKFRPFDSTAVYDAVAKAVSLLAEQGGNRAIVLMTDGEDTASRIDVTHFQQLLRDQRIRLYAIGLGAHLRSFVPTGGGAGDRLLGFAARGTGGRMWFTADSRELDGVYRRISDDLHAPARYAMTVGVSRGAGSLVVSATGERVAAVSTPSQVELILDASGSMRRRVGSRTMIDAAKDVLTTVINDLPDDVRVALRVYGHRIAEGQPKACEDSQLVVPFGRIDKPKLLAAVRAVRALGTTPIGHSIKQVAADFARGGDKASEKMVILVTDGKEECGGDPLKELEALKTQGFKLRLNIVGFALADKAVRDSMQQLADSAGGRFFDAKDPKALQTAMTEALSAPFIVVDGAGVTIGGGAIGSGPIALPEGTYAIVVQTPGTPLRVENVRIEMNKTTTLQIDKQGQTLGTRVAGPR